MAKGQLENRSRSLSRTLGMQTLRSLEAFFVAQSEVGDPEFFDPTLFPFLQGIEHDWKRVRDEAAAVISNLADVPGFAQMSPDQRRIDSDDSWKVLMFRGFGFESQRNLARCPETARLLQTIPDLELAFLSILKPQTKIPYHRGVTKSLITCHLPLLVPSQEPQNCRLRVGNETRHWEEGRCLVFDDSNRHKVWNRTDEHRVVLLFHFPRPMRPAGRIAGKLVRSAIRHSPYVRRGKRNQIAWEARIDAAEGPAAPPASSSR